MLARLARIAAIWLLLPLATAAAQQAPTSQVIDAEYEALFQRMYKEPANLDLAFKFAEQATARGDLEAAIGTLERMLLFNPNLPRVRVELGILYFRLGSYPIAHSYFDAALKSADMPPEIRTRIEAFMAEIGRRTAPYTFSMFAQAGARYQTNANSGPGNGIVRANGFFGTFESTIDPASARRADWNWFTQAALVYSHTLGTQKRDMLELTLTTYYSRQLQLQMYNLGLVEATLGPRFTIESLPNGSIRLYGIGSAVLLGDASYFNAPGAGLSVRSALGDFGMVEGLVEYRHRFFKNSAYFPTAAEQTGDLFTAAVFADAWLGPIHWTGRLGFDHNRADVLYNYNTYNRASADGGLPFAFMLPIGEGGRQFVFTPTAGLSFSQYAAPNPLIDPTVSRRDIEYRTGAIFDAQIYQGFGLRTQVQYSRTRSNLPNFDTSNFSVAFGPTARF